MIVAVACKWAEDESVDEDGATLKVLMVDRVYGPFNSHKEADGWTDKVSDMTIDVHLWTIADVERPV